MGRWVLGGPPLPRVDQLDSVDLSVGGPRGAPQAADPSCQGAVAAAGAQIAVVVAFDADVPSFM